MLEAATGPRKRNSDQEKALVNLIHQLGEGWTALYIHLSKISKAKRNENIVFALQMFEGFIRPYEGHFLIMKNGDWVFVYRDIRAAEIRAAVAKLRQLFADDPLYYSEEKYEAAFATWYDLDRERTEFTRLAEMLLAERMIDPTPPPPDPVPVTPDDRLRRRASELVSLGRIVDAIERTDLSPVLRRQPVCFLEPGARPRDLFEEVYFSIPDLEALLRRGPLITEDVWGFQNITRALDLKLLALLAPICRSTEQPNISINLNVASVLAAEFVAFDRAIGSASKQAIAVEFQFTDVFADVGAFLFARSFLGERGYAIVLDGVTDMNLPFVDRRRIGADLVKIRWSPTLTEERFRRDFASFVSGDEVSQVVLCRCDGPEAVELGTELGIRLFQGRHLSALMAPPAGEPPFLASLRSQAAMADA